jgi:MFS transporter, DHA2 family, multidrug resistance protein
MGLIFVPLATVTMGGLPNEQMGNAAGIFNLMRNLGGSVGISVVTTMLSRGAQVHQNFLDGTIRKLTWHNAQKDSGLMPRTQ